MKRSTAVVLVLSGAMLTGCGRREDEQQQAAARDSQVVTNDTYIEGRGYYHARHHAFFPFPYNFYSPGFGYYRGGRYYSQPDLTVPPPSYPGRSLNAASTPAHEENVNRGGFTRTGSSSSSRGWSWRSTGS